MRVFVSYKSQDIELVKYFAEKLQEISPQIQVSIIRTSDEWQKTAIDHIKKSDYIVYLAGYMYSEYIDWEIDEAIKRGYPVYCMKLHDDVVLDDRLYASNEFDDGKKHLKIEQPMTFEELADKINNNRQHIRTKLFSNGIANDNMLMEQYKLMLSTSETLIDRRQRLTTTYISIFSALLPVLTYMLSGKTLIMYVGSAIISFISCILCLSWRNAISAYGKSNRAKFIILEEIEKCLPAAMFASEWMALKTQVSKYKSYTKRETTIPMIFLFVYVVICVVASILSFTL